ncbi:GTPase IMAP family member 1-like [Chroicocephalus ridibundus]|uniref:GTPase IMAP family member 1-like n=1 Tax=Chroicocephalus ridibundus TaxID=1192867 RepID=UPI002FDCBB29
MVSATLQLSAGTPKKEPEPQDKPCPHGQSKTPSGLAPSAGRGAPGEGKDSTAAGGKPRLGAAPSVAVAIQRVPIPVLPGDSEGSGLRLLLVGRSRAGKSSTGNILLGERVFRSNFGTQTVTSSCSQAQGRWGDEDVTVIDTADILNPRIAIGQAYKEISHCVRLSSPGPHALLLVTKLGQFFEEDTKAVQRLQDIFGVHVLRHTIVLLAHAEEAAEGSLQEHLCSDSSNALLDLILQCGRRYCSFHTRAVGARRDQQVAKLMAMVYQVVRENGGKWYGNAMFLEPSLTQEKVEYHMGRHKAERKMMERSSALPCRMLVGFKVLFFVFAMVFLNFLLVPKSRILW